MTKQNPYRPFLAKVDDIAEIGKDARYFKISFLDEEIQRNFDYKPGQFMMWNFLGSGEAPFSISSSPTRKGYLEFGIRRVGRVTNKIFELKVGDIIAVRGPYGNGFDMERLRGRNIILVMGGLGAVPLRSVLIYILDRRDMFGKVWVLHGSKSPDEFLFKEWFFMLKETVGDIEFYYSVDADPQGVWPYDIGVVTTLFKYIDDFGEGITNAIICGPPVMYKFVVKELLKRGIPEHRILMTLERRMHCGIGKCGRCRSGNIYICRDGPVFSYSDVIIKSKELV